MSASPKATDAARRGHAGQALVEFSLSIIVFLVLLMGVFDFGRAVYVYNGLSEAAREIARVTSVHPGLVLGQSTQTQGVVTTQLALVPGMETPSASDFACVLVDGSASTDDPCQSGDYVRVTVRAAYTPISLLGMLPTFSLTASSSIQLP